MGTVAPYVVPTVLLSGACGAADRRRELEEQGEPARRVHGGGSTFAASPPLPAHACTSRWFYMSMPCDAGTIRAKGGPLHGAAPALRPAKSPLPHPSPPLQRAGRPSLCITAGPAPHFAAVLGGPRAVNSLISKGLMSYLCFFFPHCVVKTASRHKSHEQCGAARGKGR